jgi:hypothetical protein
MKKKTLHWFITIVFVFMSKFVFCREYIVYSIVQNVPMGEPNEVVKKNYYVNIGQNQGVAKGTILDVFRTISRLDPYETKKRYNYRVKVGEIEILHSQDNSAIAHLNHLATEKNDPLFEVEGIMIGDQVSVKIK